MTGTIGTDRLRRRMTAKAIRPPRAMRPAIPPTTPPTIAPMFTFLLGAAVWVGTEEVTVALELVLVAWGTGDDSGPPETKISECRPIGRRTYLHSQPR